MNGADLCEMPCEDVGSLVKAESTMEGKNGSPAPRSSMTLVLQTICIYTGFICLGMCDSILGPTLTDVQVLLGTDTAHLSAVFTANNIGYLTGAAAAGALFDHFPAEPQLAMALGVAAVSISVALAHWDLVSFVVAMGVEGVGLAYVDAGTPTYCLSVWRHHRFQDAVVQGIFVAWSVGSTVGPLLMQPFLSSTHQAPRAGSEGTGCFLDARILSSTLSINKTIHSLTNHLNVTAGMNSTNILLPSDAFPVAFGYMVIGLLLMPVSTLYLVLYVVRRKRSSVTNEPSGRTKTSASSISLHSKQICLVATLSLFFLLYVGLEVTTGGFLPLFATNGLCWSTKQSALLNSLFWSFTGLGRLVGVPASLYLEPIQMLLVNLTLTLTAFLLLATLAGVHPAVTWCAAALAGLGVSTVYPCAYLWCGRYVRITGIVTGVLLFGGSVGSMTLPLMTGLLMERVSPWMFVRLMAAISGGLFAICITVQMYVTRCMTELSKDDEHGSEKDADDDVDNLEETEGVNMLDKS